LLEKSSLSLKPLFGEEMLIKVFTSAPALTVQTEYLIYTKGDFLADLGGLMGMLVGVSLLSIYDKIVEMFSLLQRKLKSK